MNLAREVNININIINSDTVAEYVSMKPYRHQIPIAASKPPRFRMISFPECWKRFTNIVFSYHDSLFKRSVKQFLLALLKPLFRYAHKNISHQQNFFAMDPRKRFGKRSVLSSNQSFLESSAMTLLEDDPSIQEPLARAASLVIAALDIHQTIQAGYVMFGDPPRSPRDYSQYKSLFGRAFTVQGKAFRPVSADDSSHICVLYRGYVYKLETLKEGRIIHRNGLIAQLQKIVDSPPGIPPTLSVGCLSAEKPSNYVRYRHKLSRFVDNKALFKVLENALFVLALDLDTIPRDDEAAGRHILADYHNRFYFTSTQLVVLGNGQAGTICSFRAGLDGATIIPASAWIATHAYHLKKACIRYFDGNFKRPEKLPFNFIPLKSERFEIDRKLHNEKSLVEINGFGSGFFKSHAISPDSTFHVAVFWAIKRIYGRPPQIFEMLDMKHWQGGTLLAPMCLTREIEAFIHQADTMRHILSPERQKRLLMKAINSHQRVINAAKNGGDPFSVLLGTVFHPNMPAPLRVAFFGLTTLVQIFRPIDIITSNISITKRLPGVKYTSRPGVTLTRTKLFAINVIILNECIKMIFMPSRKQVGRINEIKIGIEKCLRDINNILGYAGEIPRV